MRCTELVGVPPMMRWTVISFQAEYHRHDAAPRHTLCRIGCGNHGARPARAPWHQRSAGAADVPGPVDLEWPRRAIVGAIVVIGLSAPVRCSVHPRPFRAGHSLKSQTIALSSITGKHRTISRRSDLRNCENTNAPVNEQAQREVRSGKSETVACNGLTVPPTGRVQQHEQMEAARGSRILGSSG